MRTCIWKARRRILQLSSPGLHENQNTSVEPNGMSGRLPHNLLKIVQKWEYTELDLLHPQTPASTHCIFDSVCLRQ